MCYSPLTNRDAKGFSKNWKPRSFIGLDCPSFTRKPPSASSRIWGTPAFWTTAHHILSHNNHVSPVNPHSIPMFNEMFHVIST